MLSTKPNWWDNATIYGGAKGSRLVVFQRMKVVQAFHEQHVSDLFDNGERRADWKRHQTKRHSKFGQPDCEFRQLALSVISCFKRIY